MFPPGFGGMISYLYIVCVCVIYVLSWKVSKVSRQKTRILCSLRLAPAHRRLNILNVITKVCPTPPAAENCWRSRSKGPKRRNFREEHIHEDVHSVHVDALRMQVSSLVVDRRAAIAASLFRKFCVPRHGIMARSFRRFIHGQSPSLWHMRNSKEKWVLRVARRAGRRREILHSSLRQMKWMVLI